MESRANNVFEGVNTGFGGSADTRTRLIKELQATLIRELDSGVLTNPSRVEFRDHSNGDHTAINNSLANTNANNNTSMPEDWVRASILIRINSLVTGHSGVRPVLIERMAELLKHDIVPRIPLRGSISASGDLMPLSYIGSTLEGKHGTMVWAGKKPNRRLVSAAEALSEVHVSPIQFGPKEGLAVINGTAVSTGVGLLAVHDANSVALLSQALTAMSVEALRGTTESFDSLFGSVRMHTGQKTAATNIRNLLVGSALTFHNDGSTEASLRQDRYAIRTAAQWVGPILEDLELASRQITIECNSVTDNPLLEFGPGDTMENPRILHGGNFQAKVVTSAVEKTRLGLQSIGQMLFAQCTEIINPRMNNGLPPNLSADEPSESFLCKPTDIMIAALQSELGFLANPAGTAVQSAEMGNQSLNSLALISARYTHTALEVLSQLAACHLFVLCQALDLRAMHHRFLDMFRPKFAETISDVLSPAILKGSTVHAKPGHDQSLPAPLKTPSEVIEIETNPVNGTEISANGKTSLDGILQSILTLELGDVVSGSDISGISTIQSNGYAEKNSGHSSSSTLHSNGYAEKNLGLSSSETSPPESPTFESKANAIDKSLAALETLLWKAFIKQLDSTTTQDSSSRFHSIFKSLQPIILEYASSSLSSPLLLPAVMEWTKTAADVALDTFLENRNAYFVKSDATPLLGKGSRAVYSFVRNTLGVPFLRTDLMKEEGLFVENGIDKSAGAVNGDGGVNGMQGKGKQAFTSGEMISRIFEAIRDDSLIRVVAECVEEGVEK